MTVDTSGMDEVWNAAKKVEKGSRVTVRYWSKRAEKVKTVEGDIDRVYARPGICKIEFTRDDGQEMIVRSDDEILSVGSHYPSNGDVVEVLVDGQPTWV